MKNFRSIIIGLGSVVLLTLVCFIAYQRSIYNRLKHIDPTSIEDRRLKLEVLKAKKKEKDALRYEQMLENRRAKKAHQDSIKIARKLQAEINRLSK
tara:strand:+ start:273 stop:560 length:288 start_codon:yes stop_codon:yes gene_type:complete